MSRASVTEYGAQDVSHWCATCDRPLTRDEYMVALRKDLPPGGGWAASVCDECRARESKGLPIERHGERAPCLDEYCPEHPHVVICPDCEKPVLMTDRLGTAMPEPSYGIHRKKMDGLFPHGGHHYACSNGRAHARLRREKV